MKKIFPQIVALMPNKKKIIVVIVVFLVVAIGVFARWSYMNSIKQKKIEYRHSKLIVLIDNSFKRINTELDIMILRWEDF